MDLPSYSVFISGVLYDVASGSGYVESTDWWMNESKRIWKGRSTDLRVNYLINFKGGDFIWKTNTFTASQEIIHILWNPLVHAIFHNKMPLDTILSQMNQVQAISSYLFKNCFNRSVPSIHTRMSSKLLFLLRVSSPKSCIYLFPSLYAQYAPTIWLSLNYLRK